MTKALQDSVQMLHNSHIEKEIVLFLHLAEYE